ncbi:hypothetical protein CXB49_19400 [Chromobacterium sp. ATCC 53434]|uniref:retropepsin-like aspartic protease n=1 Tax=Chromobacterium TaxID=535 RepID=UPI000C75ED88|nr:retropepsin-like aspartic protease [Chromobacterium sp. ATCC 53434]AUH52798.1 hypothetical protein CXB49_19400 [Chromobacterium sp. ATCC 53434]
MKAKTLLPVTLALATLGGAASAQPAPLAVAEPQIETTVPVMLQANGFVAVKARLNGIEGRFLLDTGAAITCVDRTQAARFGLDKGGKTSTSHGSAGETAVKRVAGNRLELGGQRTAADLEAYLTDFSAINGGLAEEGIAAVDGVIGINVLSAQHAVLDYAQQQLRFGKAPIAAAGYDTLALKSVAGAQLMVEGTINGVRGRFILDSAAAGGLATDDAHAAKFHLVKQPDGDKVHGIGGSVDSNVYLLDSLQLGPRFMLRGEKAVTFNLADINAVFKAKGAEEVDGLLGANVLNRGAAILDMGQSTLQLKPLL